MRSAVKPDAGFYNDGLVDITKEFQPFGPVAKRGDSFYVHSEEAFGKPLRTLKVSLDVLGDGQMYEVAWGGGYPNFIKVAIQAYQEESKSTVESYFIGGTKDTGEARVLWQRYNGTAWEEFDRSDDVLTSIDASELSPPSTRAPGGAKPYSRPVEVGGVSGRMVRAFLDRGDFGWTEYQNGSRGSRRRRPRRRQPATLRSDPAGSADRFDHHPRLHDLAGERDAGPFGRRLGDPRPRARRPPVLPSADALAVDRCEGEIGIGLGIAETALGSVVSLFVEVDPASACTTSSVVPETAWEYWTETQGWRPLDVIDGTSGLRQAGLVRFVAALDWAPMCPEFSSDAGRWVRIVTNLPDRLGIVRCDRRGRGHRRSTARSSRNQHRPDTGDPAQCA